MRATLPPRSTMNGKNYHGEKELTNAYSVVVSTRGNRLREVVTARTHMGRGRNASRVYASVWVHAPGKHYTPGKHYAGHGHAGGYGYHKASAAVAAALDSAGIKLDSDIAGRGDNAIEDALIAIVRALGFRGRTLVVRH